MAVVLGLLLILVPSLVVSQPYSFITDPSDDDQPIYVITEEGVNVSLYCLVASNGAVIRTTWQTKRSNETTFVTVTFGSGVSTGPAYLVDRIEVTGLIPGMIRSNFTLLNFTNDFNLISFRCGQVNEDARIFTLGLPVIPSLLINVPVQTVTEGEDIIIGLQQSGSDPFPPRLSSQLSLNVNPVSNTGVTVNDYNVSFTNVQRNQSGIYTLTVSNDAGTSNTTFTLDVQFPPEATLIGTDIQYVQSGSSVTVSLFNNINGNPTPTVTWTGPNGQISNEGRFTVDNMTGTLSITGFTSDDNGTYTSTVNNNIRTPLVDTIDLILAVPPGPPIGLTADDITDTNVTLGWSPPTDIGTPPVNYYRINMSPAPPPDVILNTTSTSLRVWGIIPGTYYNVSVVAVTINDALNGSLVGESSNITTFRTMLGAPMFQSVNAMADNGFINVSWIFRHTGGQEIEDVEVLCSTSGEGSSGGLYDMISCTMMNDCSNSNLMGSTKVGPITAGLSYSCRITAINANGTDLRIIDNIVPTEGIPSSPVITDTVTSPGLLVLRVRTVYPGDSSNIRFIVNITNVSDGSIISSTTHQFNNYQSNDIVNISISIPDGGSVSVSIVTINQYGSSDALIHPQVFTIDPTPTTATTSSTTSTVGSSTPSMTPTPSMTATMSEVMTSTSSPTSTNPPETVERSGLSAGAIAGIIIAVIIVLALVVLIGLILFYVYYKNRGGSYQVDRPGKKGGVTVEELDIDIGTELQDKSTEEPKKPESRPELHYADLADFAKKPPAAAAAAVDKPEGSVTKPAPIEEVQYAQIKPQAKPKDDAPNPSDIL